MSRHPATPAPATGRAVPPIPPGSGPTSTEDTPVYWATVHELAWIPLWPRTEEKPWAAAWPPLPRAPHPSEAGPPVRILVTGSRNWDDEAAIYEALYAHDQPGAVLVSGACPTGANRIAEDYATATFGWALEVHPADWDRYGKAAGFRRNAEMVALGANVCLAFIKNGSRGATHTAELAERAGIPTVRHVAP